MEETAEIGIFGGTGIYDSGLLKEPKEVEIDTPYGKPSDPIRLNSFGKCCHPPFGSGCQPSKLPFERTLVIGHEIKPSIIQFPARPKTKFMVSREL